MLTHITTLLVRVVSILGLKNVFVFELKIEDYFDVPTGLYNTYRWIQRINAFDVGIFFCRLVN